MNAPMPGTSQFWIPWAYPLFIYVPFVFAFGAIVGSFLNVVILRLPAGENLISPPSHCPNCQARLPWHENLPIVGWLRLRGRCGHCGLPISVQYPIIEAMCAVAFTATFMLYYLIAAKAPVLGGVAPEYLPRYGIGNTWPVYVLHVGLMSALLAMTVIDLRTYTIPVEIPWVVTGMAIVVHAVMPIWPGGRMSIPLTTLPHGVRGIDLGEWTIPLVGPAGLGAMLGATVGMGVSTILLRCNVLRHSFLDFDLYVREGDRIIDYPHPRRELEWEADYLGPVLLGMMAGTWIGIGWGATNLPMWAASLGGALAGMYMGAGLVWGIRILGTMGFGKEAMGLGDAHLMACVGAALGWIDVVLVFFAAPLLALAGMSVGSVLGRFFRGFQRFIPYGPWLALAAVLVMFGDRWIEPFVSALVGVPVNLP